MSKDFILETEGVSFGPFTVRLARTEAELDSCLKLRYEIFYEEYGATPGPDIGHDRRDRDAFDAVADHLIVEDERIADPSQRIVGTYRMIRYEMARKLGHFYSHDEFNIDCLTKLGPQVVELGRSCVHAEFRTRPVMQLLWQGIAEYVAHYDIRTLFGCGSFQGTDVNAIRESLSYLHHFHRAPEKYCPRALSHRYVAMDLMAKEQIDEKRAMANLPPLIKGYLRAGSLVGDGAIIDTQFNTIDVCIILKTSLLSQRYRRHYERKTAGTIAADDEMPALDTAGICAA